MDCARTPKKQLSTNVAQPDGRTVTDENAWFGFRIKERLMEEAAENSRTVITVISLNRYYSIALPDGSTAVYDINTWCAV